MRVSAGEPLQGSLRRDVKADSLSDELAWLGELSDEDWSLVTELVRLSDRDWEVLHRLLRLDSSQIANLEKRLQTDGAALLVDDGTVRAVGESGSGGAGTVVTTDGIESILDDILSRVNSVFSTVSSISGRIPNRSDIRALLMDGSFVSRISSVIQEVRDVIAGALEVAATLRDGYETWYGSGCNAGSQCAAFKSDLMGLFHDIEETSDFIQSLSCMDYPGYQIRHLDTSLLQSLVIDSAPPVVLYTLFKVLERLDPSADGTGWKSIFRDVLDAVPANFRTELIGMCGTEAELGEIGGVSGLKCRILQSEELGLDLNAARVIANRKDFTAKIIDAFLKDDVVVQADAVAGGGGGAGTNVKSPPKVVSQQAKDIADDLPDKIKDLIEARDQCLQDDADIEDQLRDCQPPVSALLQSTLRDYPPHPTFKDVKYLVSLRLDQLRQCQSVGLCSGLDANAAQSYVDLASSTGGSLLGYNYLCCAYQALNGGTGIQCPP